MNHAHGTRIALAVLGFASAAAADETNRVSNAPSSDAGSLASHGSTVSADGNVIAFWSESDDLVSGDTNQVADVFVFDRTTSLLERVSVDSSGTEADGDSSYASLAGDGRYVVFESAATNLDTDPNGSIRDVFLHDRATKTTRLISLDAAGLGADGDSGSPTITHDGSMVSFYSFASNLAADLDDSGAGDCFLYDTATGSIVVTSLGPGTSPLGANCTTHVLSGDGSVVGFTAATYSRSGVRTDLYIHDLANDSIEQFDTTSGAYRFFSDISDDGTLLLFHASDTRFVLEDTNFENDVYLLDRTSDSVTCVALARDGFTPTEGSDRGKLSGDGRFVTFESLANDFDEGDDNGALDVFLHDRLTGVTTRLSIGSLDEQGSLESYSGWGRGLSSDGSVAVFDSAATEFASSDGNSDLDVFVRSRSMIVPSWTNYGSGYPGRNGIVPTLTTADLPYRGTTIGIDIGASSGIYTIGFFFIGISRDSVATRLGGTLLVDPLFIFAIPLNPYGNSFESEIPGDWWSSGLVIDLQSLELDPFAKKGVSFTPGLELVLGDR